ncbi:MAG: hypothetical protein ACT4QC_19455 [Planctomycetaceae bacterium]
MRAACTFCTRRCLFGRLFLLSIAALCGCSTRYGESEYAQFARTRQGFVDLIAKAGGTAVIEPHAMHGFQMEGWSIDLSKAGITDEIVEQLASTAQEQPIVKLVLAGSTITDDQLKRLDGGKVLQKTVILDLSDTAITDAGLDQLKQHFVVTELNLKGSKATLEAGKRLGNRQIASPQTPKPFKKMPKISN